VTASQNRSQKYMPYNKKKVNKLHIKLLTQTVAKVNERTEFQMSKNWTDLMAFIVRYMVWTFDSVNMHTDIG
jgi:hypothetical protein